MADETHLYDQVLAKSTRGDATDHIIAHIKDSSNRFSDLERRMEAVEENSLEQAKNTQKILDFWLEIRGALRVIKYFTYLGGVAWMFVLWIKEHFKWS